MKSNLCLVFDADNTLWNTNEVFRLAQQGILETLQKGGLPISFDMSKELQTLRTCDQFLARQQGKYEYDFKLLIGALIWHYEIGMNLTEAAIKICQNGGSVPQKLEYLVDNAFNVFSQRLVAIPPLFNGTIETLRSIQTEFDKPLMILFSEGDAARLYQTIKAYEKDLKNVFDTIVLETKSKQSFIGVKRLGSAHFSRLKSVTYIHTGDSLQRDIKFANQAAFNTVYKPSNYKGYEISKTKDEQPTYIIEDLIALLTILKNLK